MKNFGLLLLHSFVEWVLVQTGKNQRDSSILLSGDLGLLQVLQYLEIVSHLCKCQSFFAYERSAL